MTNLVSEHDCLTGITTEREMTDEELEQFAKAMEETRKQNVELDARNVAANAKLAATREKFIGMGLTQEEVDLIVPADEPIHPTELAVAE